MMQTRLTETPSQEPGSAGWHHGMTWKPPSARLRTAAVCPGRAGDPPVEGSLLVAVDLTSSSQKTVACALDLATRLACRIILLHVLRRSFAKERLHLHPWRTARAHAHLEALRQLEAMLAFHKPTSLQVTFAVRAGLPEYEILRAAQEMRPDLLILGHRARSPLYRLLFGSAAHDVVDCAACPVLVVAE